MTLDEWLQRRGINLHTHLGNPVSELRKDEAADETLKFLRTAPSQELADWIGALQQPDGNVNRMTKEQLLAIADRPMMDIGRFISFYPPMILPHNVGEVIADGYKKDVADGHGHDSPWLFAAQSYGDTIASTPNSPRVDQFHKDLTGIDPRMTQVVFSSIPHKFSDPEIKALVHHAIDNPGNLTSHDVLSAAESVAVQRSANERPDWMIDVIAAKAALRGGGIGGFQPGENATEEAKRFGDTYARAFKARAAISPVFTDDHRIGEALTHLTTVFNDKGAQHFMENHMTPEEVYRAVNYMTIPTPAMRQARLNVLENIVNDSRSTGVSPIPSAGPTTLKYQILKNSSDPEQIKRMINDHDNVSAIAEVVKNPYVDSHELALQLVGDMAKKRKFTHDDTRGLMNLGVHLGNHHAHVAMKKLIDESGENQQLLAETWAPGMLNNLDAADENHAVERQITNETFQRAFSNVPDWMHEPEDHLNELGGSDFQHLDPHVFAKTIQKLGHSRPDYLLEGLPDTHLQHLHRQIKDLNEGDYMSNLQALVADEIATRKPNETISFTPNSNRLRMIRDAVEQSNDRRLPKKMLEQAGHNLQALGLNPLLDAKGNLTHERIDQHIKSLPQRSLEYKIKTWGNAGANPHSIMEQRHSDEVSKVFSVALPGEVADAMRQSDPTAFSHFRRIVEQSSDAHPTLPNRGIGWVRYTEGPDGVHIDEIQSDFGQNLRAKAQSKYGPEQMAEFERAYQQVWQGQKPHEVLHEAFLEHLRQQGKLGQPVHLWTVKPKMDLAGQKLDKDPPVHMRETYNVMPAKSGYKPSTYGKIQTQSHPDLQGEPTWETKLTKFEKMLDTWFDDRLAKGWRTQLLGAVVAGGMALANQQPPPAASTPAESQGSLVDSSVGGATGANQQTLAPQPKPAPKWTATGLPDEMHPIAHLESSFGRNINHAKHPAGEFQTAFGALGLKPMTAHFEYMKRPSLRALHPGLEDQHSFTEELKNNPRFYNQVASAHFAWLKSALGGDSGKAAYGWRWGVGAAQQAMPEQIEADPYVQKYRQMRDQQLQTKMHAMLDNALKKSVLPTTPVRMHEQKLQTLIGTEWETVAEKSEGGWKMMTNSTRAVKLLARCLLDGEEIDA